MERWLERRIGTRISASALLLSALLGSALWCQHGESTGVEHGAYGRSRARTSGSAFLEEEELERRSREAVTRKLNPSTSARVWMGASFSRAGAVVGTAKIAARNIVDANDVSAQWEQEPHDQAATDELGDYIEDSMRDLDIDGVLNDVSCGKTLCSVSIAFASVDEARRFSDSAGTPERRKQVSVERVNGQWEIDVIVERK